MSSSKNLMLAQDELELLDVTEMKKAIEVGKAIIPNVKGRVNKLVIMMGKSGVGKSTSIAALSGEELKAFSGIDGPILIDKDHVQGEGNSIKKRSDKPYIGADSAQAATSQPLFVKMKAKSASDEGYYLVDIPGFRDNKGVTQIVINSYYICRIFNIFEKISLFFVIEASFLTAGDRGQRLGKSFQEFVDMLGGVKAYQKSFSILITKAKPRLTTDEVREQMKRLMKEAANLAKNEKVLELCKLVSQGDVPIVIIIEPQIGDRHEKIPYEKAVLVTDQYQKGIQNAKKIIDLLEPHKFPNVNPTKLSKEDLQNCLQFVKNAKESIEISSNKCVNLLEGLLHSQFTIKDLKTQNCQELFEPIKSATTFFERLNEIIKDTFKSENLDVYKERLFDKFNRFQMHLSEKYFTKSEMPKILTELKDNFIMVDFLSIFNFTSVSSDLGNWLNPRNVIEDFFNFVRSENFNQKIQIHNISNDKKIQDYATQRVDQFLHKIPQSASYRVLKHKSSIIPSYFMKLAKDGKEKSFKEFFQSIEQLKCDEINFDIKDIQRIHLMIETQRRLLKNRQPRLNLQVEWKNKMNATCKQMVNKMLNYEQWTDQEANEGESYLNKLAKKNQSRKQLGIPGKSGGNNSALHYSNNFGSLDNLHEEEIKLEMTNQIQQLQEQNKELKQELAATKSQKKGCCEIM